MWKHNNRKLGGSRLTKGGQKSYPLFIGDRRVASVRGDTLHRSLSGKDHFLRGEAVAFVETVLREAERKGAKWVCIRNRDAGGKVYIAPLSWFWSKGFAFKNTFGAQQALNLQHFQIKGEKPSNAEQISARIGSAAQVQQLDLFSALA